MIKIARWCCIYGFSLSLALAILNILNGLMYDWYSIAFGLVISAAAYIYIERVVAPQIAKYQDKTTEVPSSKADESQEEDSDVSRAVKRRNRPRLKKKKS